MEELHIALRLILGAYFHDPVQDRTRSKRIPDLLHIEKLKLKPGPTYQSSVYSVCLGSAAERTEMEGF
jgi:hypothetical protein